MPFPFTLEDVFDEMARAEAAKKIAGLCDLCGHAAFLTLLIPGSPEPAALGSVCESCLRICLGR